MTPAPPPPFPPPPVLPSPGVKVSPRSNTLPLGESIQLSAEAINIPGNQGFIWRSLNAQVASVTANGLVAAAGRGTTQITVRPTADTFTIGYANVTVP